MDKTGGWDFGKEFISNLSTDAEAARSQRSNWFGEVHAQFTRRADTRFPKRRFARGMIVAVSTSYGFCRDLQNFASTTIATTPTHTQVLVQNRSFSYTWLHARS